MKKDHYLKAELYEELKNDPSIFEFIQESALDGLWYWDIENPEHEWMNPKFWTTLGYNPNEQPHLSSAWQEIINPDDLKVALENFERHCANPDYPYEQVVRYRHKTGKTVWVRCKGIAIRDESGKAIRMLGAHTDISELKNTELKLEAEISRYQHIIEGTDIGSWEWNIQTGQTIYNDRWFNILGYTRETLDTTTIDTCNSLTQPDDLKRSDRLLEEHYAGKTAFYEAELRMKHREGHWIWVLDKGKVISWTNDGKPEWMTGSHQEITERKKQAERNRAFIDQSPFATAMLDENLCYITASQKWLDTYHLHGPHTFGISIYDVFPEMQDKWKNRHQQALKGIPNSSKGEEIFLPDGSSFWLAWDIRPWYAGADTIGGILIFTEDITAQKASEIESRRIKEILEKSNEIARIGTWEVNLLTNKVQWSKITREIHEVDKDYTPTIESAINFYKEGSSRDKIRKAVNEAIENGIPYDKEVELVTKSGKTMWVRTIGQAEYSNGKARRIYGVFQDVNDLKQSELAVTKANEELRAIFNAGHVSIIGTNTRGRITHFNKGAESLLQYSAKEVIGKETPLIFHDPLEIERRAVQLKLNHQSPIDQFKILVGEAKNGKYESREWTFIRKDGSNFPVQLVVTAIKNKKNKISGYLGVAIDISETKNAEKAVKALHDMTKGQNERLKNFAQIVSHNLRSHSSNFDLLLGLIGKTYPNLEQDELFVNLAEASQNLDNTISDLHEVVLINTTVRENLTPINLRDAIEGSFKGIAQLATENNVELKNEVAADVEVLGLQAYLESTLLNLITNGIKYRSQHRDSYVIINASIRKGFVCVSVDDNGLGINLDKYRSKLFGMNKTFHNNKDARGIGLFMTKNQVEAMNGRIEVSSEVDKGSQFRVYLLEAKNL